MGCVQGFCAEAQAAILVLFQVLCHRTPSSASCFSPSLKLFVPRLHSLPLKSDWKQSGLSVHASEQASAETMSVSVSSVPMLSQSSSRSGIVSKIRSLNISEYRTGVYRDKFSYQASRKKGIHRYTYTFVLSILFKFPDSICFRRRHMV